MSTQTIFLFGLAIVLLLASYSIARVRKEYRTDTELSPVTVAAVWVLYGSHAALVLYAAYHSLWSFSVSHQLSIVSGLILIVVGTLLYGSALWEFRSFKKMSGIETDKVIATGIYRWTRNPQNIGWMLFLLGFCMLGQSLAAISLVVIFFGMFHFFVVEEEEKYLRRMLGEEYVEYCNNVPRYFKISRK